MLIMQFSLYLWNVRVIAHGNVFTMLYDCERFDSSFSPFHTSVGITQGKTANEGDGSQCHCAKNLMSP